MIRPLTEPIRTLPEVGATGTLNPTITPYVKPSVTPAPSATPLPDGWTQEKGLSGQLVFVPSASGASTSALTCLFLLSNTV